MRGAIVPLSQYAFMAWCLVKIKHRDDFAITLELSRRLPKTQVDARGTVMSELTPWSRVHLKLLVARLVKKFCTFY
jgi:hypothetical protein